MNEIRIKSGIEITVNEKGETICINAEDRTFLDKFYGLLDKFSEAEAHMKSEKVRGLKDRAALQEMIVQTREIMKEIDGLFGEGACKKVFGDIVPTPYLLAIFFDKMLPYTEQYANERQQNISKIYSRSRKGARSPKNNHRRR